MARGEGWGKRGTRNFDCGLKNFLDSLRYEEWGLRGVGVGHSRLVGLIGDFKAYTHNPNPLNPYNP